MKAFQSILILGAVFLARPLSAADGMIAPVPSWQSVGASVYNATPKTPGDVGKNLYESSPGSPSDVGSNLIGTNPAGLLIPDAHKLWPSSSPDGLSSLPLSKLPPSSPKRWRQSFTGSTIANVGLFAQYGAALVEAAGTYEGGGNTVDSVKPILHVPLSNGFEAVFIVGVSSFFGGPAAIGFMPVVGLGMVSQVVYNGLLKPPIDAAIDELTLNNRTEPATRRKYPLNDEAVLQNVTPKDDQAVLQEVKPNDGYLNAIHDVCQQEQPQEPNSNAPHTELLDLPPNELAQLEQRTEQVYFDNIRHAKERQHQIEVAQQQSNSAPNGTEGQNIKEADDGPDVGDAIQKLFWGGLGVYQGLNQNGGSSTCPPNATKAPTCPSNAGQQKSPPPPMRLTRYKWLLWSCAAVLIGGALYYFLYRVKPATPDPRLHALLKPLFLQQKISTPFNAFVQHESDGTRVTIRFDASASLSSKYGHKAFLLLPLIITSYNVEPNLPRLNEVVIESTNDDRDDVEVRSDVKLIDRFIRKEIPVTAFLEQVSFARRPWEPAGKSDRDRANSYLEHGRYFANERHDLKKAIPSLEKAVVLDPQNYDALYALGGTEFMSGDKMSAIRRLEQAIELDSGRMKAYPLLARAHLQCGDKQKAADILDQFETLYRKKTRDAAPDKSERTALYQAAEAYFHMGNAAKAEALAQDFTLVHPNDASGFYLLGRVYLGLQDFPRARDALSKATQLDPHDDWSWLLLGHALLNLKQYPQAVLAYRHSYSHGNRDGSLFACWSRAYFWMGKYVDTKQVAGEGLRYHPSKQLENEFCEAHLALLKKGLDLKAPATPLTIVD